MTHRAALRPRAWALIGALALAMLASGAWAAEIRGVVTALQEGRIRIEVEGSAKPRVGDPVRITWKLGERVLEAGRAEVDEVGTGFVMARVKEGNPNIEMQATIDSAATDRPAPSTEAGGTGGPGKDGAEAPANGTAPAVPADDPAGEIRVVQTSWPIEEGRWGWEIHLAGPAEALDRVRAVLYRLHPTFPDPDRRIDTRANGFQLRTSGWGTFTVKIEIEYEGGRKEAREHRLTFSARSK